MSEAEAIPIYEDRKETFSDKMVSARLSIHGLMLKEQYPYPEDPYDQYTWVLDKYTFDDMRAKFRNPPMEVLYGPSEKLESQSGVTAAQVYEMVRPDAYKEDEFFGGMLLENIHDDVMDMVFKVTRLSPESKFKEIANDVRVAYFLMDLIYGYEYVLSLGFVQVLDWFLWQEPDTAHYYQITLFEKCETTLLKWAETQRNPSLYKAISFQVLHALEIAHYTHGFEHLDLHPDNVMLQQVGDQSALYNKTWVYKRPPFGDSATPWYCIEPSEHENKLVKIIDFGHSSMFAPTNYANTLEHVYNQYIHTYPLNSDLDRNDTELFIRLMRVLFAQTYQSKPFTDNDSPFIVFQAINGKRHPTPTMALNSTYFDSLKRALSPATSVVVSFPKVTDKLRHASPFMRPKGVPGFFGEPVSQTTANTTKPSRVDRCVACDQPDPRFVDMDTCDFFCSQQCHQFKTLFNGKTVFR